MKKTFKWLNISQFTGALNDNAFKMTAAIVLVKLLGEGSLPTVLAICSVLFVVPFLLFSNAAGTLADRLSKRDIIIASKWLEVGLLLLAIPALLSGAIWPIYTLLFLLTAQSALFGPAKRGIVPELVEEKDLSQANGFLTAATYAAIVLGTALPALLIGFLGFNPLTVIGTSLALAIIGTVAATRIAKVPAAGTSKKSSPWILPDVVRAMKNLQDDNWAKQAVFGLVLFGGITAFFQQTLVLFGREALNLPVEQSPILFPLVAIGIGIGALLTGRFSKHTIEIGLIPVGALGVMLSAIGLSFAVSPICIALWIVTLGASCGMVLVPLNAFIQQRIPKERREMVPHGAIEEALQNATDSDEPCVAVVGIVHETKGEQLAVCYTPDAGDPEDLVSNLRNLKLPNLWIPRPANFFQTPELPMLGTGKLDLCAIQTLVNS